MPEPHSSKAARPEVPLTAGILGNRCPRCRKGHVFSSGPFHPLRFYHMHHSCNCCGQDFVIEPGFYYGAMYFTYAVNVATIVISMVVLNLILEMENTWQMVGFVSLMILVLTPLNFRASRILMLYFFADIRYDARASAHFGMQKAEADLRTLQNDAGSGESHPTS